MQWREDTNSFVIGLHLPATPFNVAGSFTIANLFATTTPPKKFVPNSKIGVVDFPNTLYRLPTERAGHHNIARRFLACNQLFGFLS
jgi:hypothetical protein